MTAMMSGVILVAAFGLVALLCLALAVALFRVTGRAPAATAAAGPAGDAAGRVSGTAEQ
jgi:hypothetical protein